MIARLWDAKARAIAELGDDRRWRAPGNKALQELLNAEAPPSGSPVGDPRFVQAQLGAEVAQAKLEMLIADPDDGLPPGTVY